MDMQLELRTLDMLHTNMVNVPVFNYGNKCLDNSTIRNTCESEFRTYMPSFQTELPVWMWETIYKFWDAKKLVADATSPKEVADTRILIGSHLAFVKGIMMDVKGMVHKKYAELSEVPEVVNMTCLLGLPIAEYIESGIHCVNITIGGVCYNPGYIRVVSDGSKGDTKITQVGLQPHLLNDVSF